METITCNSIEEPDPLVSDGPLIQYPWYTTEYRSGYIEYNKLTFQLITPVSCKPTGIHAHI
ncbi:hypothetical protein B0J17DRAFT_682412 [Rhizoctonia solani]|nr:hypothetical protein B0J17DRAFT_682412 [Rhizoctonia solani]